mmetsp:Transcript_13843/g.23570  ORF Transcript_13843/g.23570 Transcript_13843/m.23570 type:complete len:115 (-) Transcript_13843:1374-1718(-)
MNAFSFLSVSLVLLAVAVHNVVGFTVMPQKKVSVSSALHMTVLTYKGKKKDFRPGSPLKNACSALGVKPKYSCKKGECASCTISVGGSRVKACIGKVPPEPRLKSLQEKGLEIK